MPEIIKGFQTVSGIKYYDYESLENKPDLSVYLEESEVVGAPTANKILRLDSNAALPANITGKAAQVEWSGVLNKPETLQDFGLSDEVYNKSQVDEIIRNVEASSPDFALVLQEHNNSTEAHNDIRLLISELVERLNAIADSDDQTLDQFSELVEYIKDNRELIEQVTTNKISVTDIIDNLTTNVSNKPLSAAQGVALKKLIDELFIPTRLSDLEQDSTHRTVTDTEKARWNQPTIEVDATLTESGKAADAKAVGDRFSQVPTRLSQLESDSEHRTVTDSEKQKWNQPSIEVDTTLSQAGKAADSLAVGQKITNIKYKAQNEAPSNTEGLWIDLNDDSANGMILDTTLTQDGYAAEARTTGIAIKQVEDLAKTAFSKVEGLDLNSFLPVTGAKAMAGNLNLGNFRITNLATPTAASDAVNKEFATNASNLSSGSINANLLPLTPISKGGTGADNGATGLSNLFAAGPTILSTYQYGDTLPTPSTVGRIFFLKIT